MKSIDSSSSSSSNELQELEKKIVEVESYLSKIGKGDGTADSSFLRIDASISKLWAHLGGLYMLRSKPLSSDTITSALNCYNQAIIIINNEHYSKLIDDHDNDDINDDDVIKIRYEYILSWSLQKGILLSLLGKGQDAVNVYDDMLLYIQIVDKTKFDKSKNFSIDRSGVLRLKADVLMNALNDPLNASKLFNESVTINPCELDVYRLYISS
jgi:hypothetical protein